MINAYKEMGNSCVYTSCFTGAVFVLAAIIYVDDTDLLLCAQDPDAPDEVFFQAIQKAINDWAMIVMATGGSLKPSKCHREAFEVSHERKFLQVLEGQSCSNEDS